MSEEEFENTSLSYAIDNAILMHRDAHFGGNFPVMFAYYKNEGRGVSPEFDLRRIEELYEMEQLKEVNLSALTLSGPEMEKIGEARTLYKQLRDLYNNDKKVNKKSIPVLIADLILSENEDLPSAIEAVIAEKSAIVPSLIDLLRCEDFYSPFNPGYGQAPMLAAQCLGLIGDKRAIISLFEAIGNEDFFSEDIVLSALHGIGEPAKKFLLTVLHGLPLNYDNERAAIALLNFKGEQEVGQACLKMLQEIDLKKHLFLATYLVLVCEGLTAPSDRQELLEIAKRDSTPKEIKREIETVLTGEV